MMPTAELMSSSCSALGISRDDHVVVYDGKGIFSAPRAWFMFKVAGHSKVSAWTLSTSLLCACRIFLPHGCSSQTCPSLRTTRSARRCPSSTISPVFSDGCQQTNLCPQVSILDGGFPQWEREKVGAAPPPAVLEANPSLVGILAIRATHAIASTRGMRPASL
jgi:hypothetical protein